MRTLDWACQWCGYPIISGGYRKIDKTYRQLKEERLWKTGEESVEGYEQEPEPEPEDVQEMEVTDAEEESGEEKQAMEEEVKVAAEPEPEPKPESEPEPEPEPEIKQEAEVEGCAAEEVEVEEVKEVNAAVEIAADEEKEVLPAAEVTPETKVKPETEPEPEKAAEELGVMEIFKAYDEDDVAADERFAGKVLRITGVVSLIDIKNVSANHYIRLSTSEGDLMQSVQCIFDKRHATELSHLEKGQEVTVQGRYNGSVIAIRIVDCVLIA
ncbi:MAG TPA: hypothetical protein G4O19_02485 [Dehalococcoidia bacterium]|nr:hypothetical protein [Dehalococcoidia bacterium]